MSGALPLLPLYAFMAWTGKTLFSTLHGNRFLQIFGEYYAIEEYWNSLFLTSHNQ
jgi:hypothetical protein